MNTVCDFDICLGAKVAIKLKDGFEYKIQDKALELEKSEKVLTRSNAVYALGILATEKCHKRLKSSEGYKDYHHPYQRQRALALGGDKDTLNKILEENEYKAQITSQISGGSYSLWFTSPPTVITDISRERIEEWSNNKQLPLCMCLRTIAFFGDSFDVSNLLFILNETNNAQEFYDAAKALYEIDKKRLVEGLENVIKSKLMSSHWAKKTLFSLGVRCDVNDEFNYFIAQGNKEEYEIANHVHELDQLVTFLKGTNLDDTQTKTLVDTYKKLKFRSDFYYRNLMWSLAKNGKAGCFLPIVRISYLEGDPNEIHNAINYLCHLDQIEIDDDLSQKIHGHFNLLDEKNIGTFYYYIHFFYKHFNKSYAISLMQENVKKTLSYLSPESITEGKYLHSIFDYSNIFDFIGKYPDDELITNQEDSLKFLLINTSFLNAKEALVKFNILRKLEKNALYVFCNRITDAKVKTYVINYLLLHDLTENPKLLLGSYFSEFLSHHFFHKTIEYVCSRNWDDNLASKFLTCFVNIEWTITNANMFEKYTNSFCNLLTYDQLKCFEEKRNTPVNIFIQRIYLIWLESKNLAFT